LLLRELTDLMPFWGPASRYQSTELSGIVIVGNRYVDMLAGSSVCVTVYDP